MIENHFAYKITHGNHGFLYPHFELQKEKMVDLLKEIERQHYDGLFWVFKQFDNQPPEQLCIIDCSHNRIYYHYSGDVEDLKETICKLDH
ncbi:hypothetical protein [Legionella sp.]|uniref:hypothetical protein n=1 Tax=Legionella sp. TaxID=459 RepID=UPI003CAEB27E